ncbi:MAG: metallophosphoesterase [Gammaproteobacteria bacterium]|nr:metallophosphoesterase [Gammaproteobacteria bacterium]
MRTTTLLILLFGLVAVPSFAARPWEVDTPERVVSFADVHGAYDDLVQILQEVSVVDANADWSGGKTHLVSTGDLIDRGRDSRKVVELLMKLERQAAAAGGAVHVVLGNHEVMVMSGDWRYISVPEYAAFSGEETGAEREALLNEFRDGHPTMAEEELRLSFEKRFPPGFLGLQRAYAPDGELGKWLLELPLVLRVNDSLYMHGGISTEIAEQSLDDINRNNKADLKKYLQLVESLRSAGVLSRYVDFWGRRDYLNTRATAALAADPKARPDWFQDFLELAELEAAFLFSPQSPIWYRGTAYCHPYAEAFNTERLLKRSGARRVVIGHTPNPGAALVRLDGLVIRMDTGMLQSVYKGKAAVLVQKGEQRYVQYLGRPEQHQPVVEETQLTQTLSGISDAEMEAFLLQGRVVEVVEIGTGVTNPKRVTLRQGEREDFAVFKYEDTDPGLEAKSRYSPRKHNQSDRYSYDVAGYKMDRMIDLQLVPVTVLRSVEGREGALGAWLSNTVNERDRAQQEQSFSGHCPQMEQYRLRILFDVLIYNEDRNLTNILWSEGNYMLRLIDHSLAFRSLERRPKQYRKIALRLSDLFRQNLQTLNRERLDAELSAYLHPRQIEAILGRRDLILREAKNTNP